MLLTFVFSAKPPNNKITIGDDKANWEAVYKESYGNFNQDVGRTSMKDEDVFNRILRINAKERGMKYLI